MATVSAFSTSHSVYTPNAHKIPSYPSFTLTRSTFHVQSGGVFVSKSFKHIYCLKTSLKKTQNSHLHVTRKLRSVEEETTIPEEEVQQEEAQEELTEQQTVSVPVSPSDTITMFFQAEGTMNEATIPKVTKVLEETEGVANLKVQVLEGLASVELTKQTTVQATGVASGLVELIQGSGFKLQTLNLSFQDEEDLV